jgi:RimJ/RimL family protein N-acetyltransferase
MAARSNTHLKTQGLDAKRRAVEGMTQLVVREMTLHEADIIIDYFHGASHDFLKSLGVSPAKLPYRDDWEAFYRAEYTRPIHKRRVILVLWELDGEPVGFSTADQIVFGQEAYMHLHILHPERRRSGYGATFVKETVKIYFSVLKIQQLYCEPYAFNAAPNRTLQKAGFKYIKTYETTPGPLNFKQPVNRWLLESDAFVSDLNRAG